MNEASPRAVDAYRRDERFRQAIDDGITYAEMRVALWRETPGNWGDHIARYERSLAEYRAIVTTAEQEDKP